MESESDSDLESSELGTKQYWDKTYNNELNNFNNHGDVGEVWFGEESVIRVVQWLQENYQGSKEDPIIDLGCGNGMMLMELAREGFVNLTGVDYSEKAVNLANSITSKLGVESSVSFKVCDIVADDINESYYSIAHDKGTYDAICLHPENPKEKRLAYVQKVHRILKQDGLFIITSCNWTDDEVISHFKDYFKLHTVIPTPEFKFGGKVGKLISCLVLQKIN